MCDGIRLHSYEILLQILVHILSTRYYHIILSGGAKICKEFLYLVIKFKLSKMHVRFSHFPKNHFPKISFPKIHFPKSRFSKTPKRRFAKTEFHKNRFIKELEVFRGVHLLRSDLLYHQSDS